MKIKFTTKKITLMAMLIAISYVLMLVARFPLMTSYLKYDPADVPLVVGAILWGPFEGLVMAFITCTIKGLTAGNTGPWGVLMSILSSTVYCVTVGFFYRFFNKEKEFNKIFKKSFNAMLGFALIIGSIALCLVMIPANLLVTPLYTGQPVEAVADMIVPILIPFNIIKALINSVFTFIIYKALRSLLNKYQF